MRASTALEHCCCQSLVQALSAAACAVAFVELTVSCVAASSDASPKEAAGEVKSRFAELEVLQKVHECGGRRRQLRVVERSKRSARC